MYSDTGGVLLTHFYNSHSKQWYSGDLFLEENVFLGCNVIVCKGVKIGRNCVVGVGSIVNKDLDSDCVYAGVPARKVGEHKL